ncbi:MAG: helix-turn-helix transcriptional regulator [Ignavibacteriales bacterium]|nr:helix-turn-helix transcriptional regulator [Ignavibacteriales bacterium]
MANTIVTEKVKNFNLDAMEKLCLVLNCTPHDLLVWEPDASITEPSKFELSKLIRQKEIVKLSEQLRGLTIAEIEEVNRFVEEKRKNK